jgi:peptidoglycan/LPS O-acetylase OafA/YrhL
MSGVRSGEACWPHAALAKAAPARECQAFAYQPGSRIEHIDVARGLLVMWMVVGHALTVARIPPTHPLQLLRPAGWSTICFAMLSGFALAVIYGRRDDALPVVRRRLWHRGTQLLVIAFVSNLVSLLITLWVSGNLSAAGVVSIVTFRVPWTISGILIATGLLVLASPGLLWLRRRFGALKLSLALLLGDMVADIVCPHLRLVRQALTATNWLFAFPVLPIFLWGAVVFGLADLEGWLRRQRDRRIWVAAGIVAVPVLAVAAWPPFLPAFPSIAALSRLAVIVGLASAVSRLEMLTRVKVGLMAVGRSSLPLFLLHRPLLRMTDLLLHGRIPAEGAALMMIAGVGTSMVVLGLFRPRAPALSVALRRVGL